MHYAPRTIALITELFHPPIPPDPAPVQRVHNQLFQAGNSPYQGFVVTPQGPVNASSGNFGKLMDDGGFFAMVAMHGSAHADFD